MRLVFSYSSMLERVCVCVCGRGCAHDWAPYHPQILDRLSCIMQDIRPPEVVLSVIRHVGVMTRDAGLIKWTLSRIAAQKSRASFGDVSLNRRKTTYHQYISCMGIDPNTIRELMDMLMCHDRNKTGSTYSFDGWCNKGMKVRWRGRYSERSTSRKTVLEIFQMLQRQYRNDWVSELLTNGCLFDNLAVDGACYC